MVLASRILGVAIRWPCLSTSLTSPAVLGKQRCPSVQWLYRRAGMEVQLVSLHKIISLQLPLSRLSSLPGRCPSAVPAAAQWRGLTWSLEPQLWGRAAPQERHRQCGFRRDRHLTHLPLSGPWNTTPGDACQLGLLGLFCPGILRALAL